MNTKVLFNKVFYVNMIEVSDCTAEHWIRLTSRVLEEAQVSFSISNKQQFMQFSF